MTEPQSRLSKINIVILAFILALGIFLRIPPHTFSPGEPLHALVALLLKCEIADRQHFVNQQHLGIEVRQIEGVDEQSD